ncbi:DUF1576 domain-containing protein [Senegalia massiliensis]|uniref:DUF1576 domain-containing protein n=1 Tax=Senegalia massiliensis TaxID=1720316 RepID=UPI0010322477|nr:DUF1576 domain-containing protein [Senegalia massiliensis]
MNRNLSIQIDKTENSIIKYVLLILPISFTISAFFLDDIDTIIKGLYSIMWSEDILLTDYLEIAGIGATLINSAIITFFNLFLLHKLKVPINGTAIAGVFIVAGFSFFGKNIFNVWPIYIGTFIYSVYQGRKYRSVIYISMFATALSPIVSQLSFGLGLPLIEGIVLGWLFGIGIGFIITPLSAHLVRAHDGYNIYNVGFTAGFIATVLIAVLRSYGLDISSQSILSSKYDIFLKVFLLSFSIILILIGYLLNKKTFKGYREIFEYSGRLVTDFILLIGIGNTFVNMGLMGVIAIIYVIISGGAINGPIVGGILTIIGFSAFGKHPKNTIPILLGVFAAGLLNIWHINSTVVIIAGLFSTTLAPIAGEYGPFAGFISGFLHLAVVMNVGVVHGGVNLYNNGFSGGIVASVLVPILDTFSKGD